MTSCPCINHPGEKSAVPGWNMASGRNTLKPAFRQDDCFFNDSANVWSSPWTALL
jgi:hypothetical protein